MGQVEIEKILKRSRGEWVSTIDLKLKLNQTSNVITRALNKMFQYGEVEKKKSAINKYSKRSVFFWRIK